MGVQYLEVILFFGIYFSSHFEFIFLTDFEIARAAAAAKRRAWAYNNRSSEPVVQQSTVVDNSEEEEYNSISICESSTKWSKSGNNKSEIGDGSGINNTPPNTPRSRSNSTGSTNFGFVEDDVQMEKDVEVIHEMAVDCPPDFVSPVKSLSLKRGGPSPRFVFNLLYNNYAHQVLC